MAPPPARVFQYAFAIAIATAITGLWIDIWAHIHEATEASETFFTSWHAIMYGGIGLAGLLLVALWLTRWRSNEGLPAGLEVSLAGVLLFGLGGASDLGWHTLFGVEANLEALLSPTHTALYVAAFLVFVGPLRMRRLAGTDGSTWTDALPAVASVVCIVQLMAVFSQFFNPVSNPWASAARVAGLSPDAAEMSVGYGYVGLIMTTLLASGTVLGFIRYMTMPRGAWALVLGLSTVGAAYVHDEYSLIPVGLAAGIAAELALGWGSASLGSRIRLAATVVPLAWTATYLGILALTAGIAWSPHITASALVVPPFVGLTLSLIQLPTAALTRWDPPPERDLTVTAESVA